MVRRSRRAERRAGPERKREGRLRRHLRVARDLYQEPGHIFPFARGLFVETWRSRGGGFYGLGYVVTFVWFEVNVFVTEFAGSDSIGGFAFGQLLEYLLRVGLLSFVNMLRALLWPFFVLEHLGAVGIILLVAAYAAFEYALKPVVEQIFPELREPVSPKPDQ